MQLLSDCPASPSAAAPTSNTNHYESLKQDWMDLVFTKKTEEKSSKTK